MKVGSQGGNHQSGTSAKAFTNQGHPIEGMTFVVSALNPPYLLLYLSMILIMTVKVTFFIITHQQ